MKINKYLIVLGVASVACTFAGCSSQPDFSGNDTPPIASPRSNQTPVSAKASKFSVDTSMPQGAGAPNAAAAPEAAGK
jgi:uncharacterized lipoprotein YajG